MGRVLVACEESQAVTKEFRKLGIEAWSCDLEPCSGGHPEWHLRQDVIPLLDEDWAMILAFPPCTHLAVSGARWFSEKRKDGRQQVAIDFFLRFAGARCERVAIENPVSIMSTVWRKPDQIIQPWMFGDPYMKTTCLWFKNLPPLVPTNIVKGREQKCWRMGPSPERARLRAQTYPGIAQGIAKQWGGLL